MTDADPDPAYTTGRKLPTKRSTLSSSDVRVIDLDQTSLTKTTSLLIIYVAPNNNTPTPMATNITPETTLDPSVVFKAVLNEFDNYPPFTTNNLSQ